MFKMLFENLVSGQKFKIVNVSDFLIWNKKRVYTKLPERMNIGYDVENGIPVFANAECRGFQYDISDEVEVLVIE